MRERRVVVIGAGIGGLTAGLELTAHGLGVTIVDKEAAVGGKMRRVVFPTSEGDVGIDAGPTVFTMRWVLDELFDAIGARLDDHITLHPAETLARHAWSDASRLDLFADLARSADAVAAFAGLEARAGFLAFAEASRHVYRTLERPFLRAPRPSVTGLVAATGFAGLGDLARIGAFRTLWGGIGRYFADPRLRQLFGRYATYCGSSPFESPATLMLIAHVEQDGVWLVEGGMHRVATALADLAAARGVRLRLGELVSEVVVRGGRAAGVRLASGEVIEADAVISNADAGALRAGAFGRAVKSAAPGIPPRARSFSALTFAMHARATGFPLIRHTVFFSSDYRLEFNDLRRHARLPQAPTIYVCAQDRADLDTRTVSGDHGGAERLLVLINAPPTGDIRTPESWESETCASRIIDRLHHYGLDLTPVPGRLRVTTPTDFHRLFPATGGALYGRASHGWAASFRRASTSTRLPGLYLAGGSTHPGPGVPMAARSGRLAAARLITDLTGRKRTFPANSTSEPQSRPAGMPGGTSTA